MFTLYVSYVFVSHHLTGISIQRYNSQNSSLIFSLSFYIKLHFRRCRWFTRFPVLSPAKSHCRRCLSLQHEQREIIKARARGIKFSEQGHWRACLGQLKKLDFLLPSLMFHHWTAIESQLFITVLFNRFLKYDKNNFVYKSRILTFSQLQCEYYFRSSASWHFLEYA